MNLYPRKKIGTQHIHHQRGFWGKGHTMIVSIALNVVAKLWQEKDLTEKNNKHTPPCSIVGWGGYKIKK